MPGRLILDPRELLLAAATEEARRRGDRRLGTEHLVLGLLHDGGSEAARALGVPLADARAKSGALDLAALAAVGVEVEPLGQGTASSSARRLLPLSSGARAALKRATAEARACRSERVDATHLLLALLARQRPDPAAELLGALGVDPAQVRKRLAGPPGGRLSGLAATQDDARSRLPAHHISRPRLTAGCVDERVVVVEAAGGYGKSVLAAELVDAWGAVPVWVLLEEGGVTARLLVARLRLALLRAGLTGAAGTMASVGDDPPGAVDAMLAAIAGESCAVVIDDVHHADPAAAGLVDRMASQLAAPQHLVVLARHLPLGLARLRRAGPAHLGATELALRPHETLELCRTGFGLQVSEKDAGLLDLATGGWTAAVVLAASRAKRTAAPLAALARVGAARSDAMQSILEEALSAAGADRALFAQLAVPPLLDGDLLEQITGEDGFLERALAWGLPMTRAEGGWWELPAPVREHLAALGPAQPSVLRTAAAYYERHGAFGTALQMLLGASDVEAAAALLDGADPWVIDTVDALELLSVLDAIPGAVLDRFPRALLSVARCCAGSWMTAQATRLMARLDAMLGEDGAPELRRALDVELLVQAVNGGDAPQAEAGARRVLAAVSAAEQLTRARALTVMGQALCQRRDDKGRLDAAALREAADYLGRASEIQLSVGNRPAAATITIFWALWVELALGRPESALEVLNKGLELAAEHPRRFAQILWCRAHVLTELGRQADVDADLDGVARIAGELGDRWIVPYVAWERMSASSLRGDAEATLRHAREAQAEAGTGYWWKVDGAEFLADAADCLDRVGATALATAFLERAKAEPQKAGPQIAMAECALLARHGDPELAETALVAAPLHGIAPREQWRLTLFAAYAAYRRGDPGCGALAARAFEQAAALGQPHLPLLRERELTESMLALAVDTALPAATALEHSALPMALAVLGRFELTCGGRTVALGASQEARLLKLVAVKGGQVHVEQAIEALWPEVKPGAGRHRLRTVLNRLRHAATEVVSRQGERLALGAEVRLDLAQFTSEAREARALAGHDLSSALAVARSAITRYRGPLLPHDPYEEWAEEPRESARRTMLDVLDLCAEAAAQRGDLDEARRMVERSIALAPYDDHRYLEVASILHRQGRKGAALSVLRRARSTLAELGVAPPTQLVELERRVAATASIRVAEPV